MGDDQYHAGGQVNPAADLADEEETNARTEAEDSHVSQSELVSNTQAQTSPSVSESPPEDESLPPKSEMLDPENRPDSTEPSVEPPLEVKSPQTAQEDEPAVVTVEAEQSEPKRASRLKPDDATPTDPPKTTPIVEKIDRVIEKVTETSPPGFTDSGSNGAVPQDEVPIKKGWRYFWRRTKADITNKNLIAIKILFFSKAATLFVLYPFLTLHIKSLGLSPSEAGINAALTPLVAIFGHPVAGIIADKIGNFKILLSGLTFTTAGFALLLLLVPPARETHKLPSELTFSLECGGQDQRFMLEMVENTMCTYDGLQFMMGEWKRLPPATVQCGSFCPSAGLNGSKIVPFGELPMPANASYMMPAQGFVFTPSADHKPGLICDRNANNISCYLGFAETAETAFGTTVRMDFSELKPMFQVTHAVNVTNLTLAMSGQWKFDNQVYPSAPHCFLNASGSASSGSNTCEEKCFVQYDRALFCSNDEEVKVYDVSTTFWMYTLFRTFLGLGSATTWIMFEGAVLAILKECGGDYGLQRVSAVLAAIFVSPLSGTLIYQYKDFRPAFYLYAALQCVSALLTLKIDLTFKLPGEHVLGHLKEVLSQFEILIFFCAMFLSGSAWGYLESFLFWFLKDLGGNEILMGLTISVGGIAGIPLLIVSRVIIKKIGHVNVLCLGLLFYGIRLFGYSYIVDPWLCLPFEAMEAITVSLAITAAATYAAALSTEQTIASIQGFMGALYFGIGRGAGSLVGGFLIDSYGARPTFRIFGVAAFVSCAVYFVLNILYIRNHTRVEEGLDLHNLRGDSFDELAFRSSKNKGQSVKDGRENRDKDDGSYRPSMAFVGPVDINSFTDIPLDEEEGGLSTNFTKRPASLPQMRNKSSAIHRSRASDTQVMDR